MKSLGIVSLSLLLVAGASAQSLRSQIDAFDKKVVKLMAAKDMKALNALMKGGVTSDFKYVEGGQTQAYDQMAASMAAGLGQMKSLDRVDAHTLTLKEKGDKATATTVHTMVGKMLGQDKKPHLLSFSGTSEDSYVKQGGKWKMSRMSWIKQTMLMDGKPMPGMK